MEQVQKIYNPEDMDWSFDHYISDSAPNPVVTHSKLLELLVHLSELGTTGNNASAPIVDAVNLISFLPGLYLSRVNKDIKNEKD